MRPSTVRTRWKQDRCAFGVAALSIDPAISEMISLMGFDFIWMDLEHSWRSLETAGNLMRAARVGAADVLARPAKGEFLRLGRMLEAGATGIMYPRCDHADEAAEVVRWMKFPPVGQRGLDGAGADVPYAALDVAPYVRQANENTWLLVQIEDPQALEQVESIARVPGVDGLFFGPGDFSLHAGIPGQFDHPMLKDAARRVAGAARAAGKVWGMPALSVELARTWLEWDARLLVYGTDLMVVKEGYEAIQRSFVPLGFRFDNRLQTDHGAATHV